MESFEVGGAKSVVNEKEASSSESPLSAVKNPSMDTKAKVHVVLKFVEFKVEEKKVEESAVVVTMGNIAMVLSFGCTTEPKAKAGDMAKVG